FLLQRRVSHRDLHSFPTRRSSDLPEYYAAYAKYFVKYIQEMAAEGIRIDAITVQNEPLHPGNNPSLLMLADEMAEFIKDHLGPRSEEHTSELQSRENLVCRLLLEK